MSFKIEPTPKQMEGLAWVVSRVNDEISIRNKDKEKVYKESLKADPKASPPKYEEAITEGEYLGNRVSDILNDYYRQKVVASADQKWDKEVAEKTTG